MTLYGALGMTLDRALCMTPYGALFRALDITLYRASGSYFTFAGCSFMAKAETEPVAVFLGNPTLKAIEESRQSHGDSAGESTVSTLI